MRVMHREERQQSRLNRSVAGGEASVQTQLSRLEAGATKDFASRTLCAVAAGLPRRCSGVKPLPHEDRHPCLRRQAAAAHKMILTDY